MLTAIYNGLMGIVDFFSMLMDVVIDLFTGLVDFMKSLAEIPSLFSSVFGSSGLPSVFVAGIVSVVLTIIILRIIGRD